MESTTATYKYYKKSRLYFRIALYTLVWISLYSSLFKNLNIHPIFGALAIVFPALAVYILVPMGIVCTIRSYTNKEPFNRFRLPYLIGHLFLLFILVVFIIAISADLKSLYR
jgi:hypothetical protein